MALEDQLGMEPILITGPDPPSPLLSPGVLKNLRQSGSGQEVFSLSLYQNHIIPIIQSKRDLMACSNPDPAAYLIPIISEIEEKKVQTPGSINNNPSVSPHCLIVTPTIRNTNQIKQVADKITGEGGDLKTLALNQRYLSEDLKEEVRKGSHILVARPQGLLELIEEKLINLMEVKVVVLDEAYILTDLLYYSEGWMDSEMDVIMRELPDSCDRQTLVFSKYLSDETQENLWEFLKKDYLFAALGVYGAQKSSTEAALEDLTLEELELDEELGNVNQKLNLFKSQESQCKKTLAENIKKQEVLFASNEGELKAREVEAPLIWDMGDLTREMILIELMTKKKDLQAEMDDVRKKLRGLEREAQVLENEKSKLADFISELEYRFQNPDPEVNSEEDSGLEDVW